MKAKRIISATLAAAMVMSLAACGEKKKDTDVTPAKLTAPGEFPVVEEKYIDKLSANYLSSYVLDIAGVRLTEYNKYLLKLSETLPVIDTVGYIDNNNNYYKWSDTSDYKNILGEETK